MKPQLNVNTTNIFQIIDREREYLQLQNKIHKISKDPSEIRKSAINTQLQLTKYKRFRSQTNQEQKKIKSIQQDNKQFLERLIKIQNRKDYELLPKKFKVDQNEEKFEKFLHHKKNESKFKNHRSKTIDVQNYGRVSQNFKYKQGNQNNPYQQGENQAMFNSKYQLKESQNGSKPDLKILNNSSMNNFNQNNTQRSQTQRNSSRNNIQQYDSGTLDVQQNSKVNKKFSYATVDVQKTEQSRQNKIPATLINDYNHFIENNRHKIYTNKTQRNKKEKEITEQNRRMVGRIINQKSNYNKDTLNQQYQKHQKDLGIRKNTAFQKTEMIQIMLRQNNMKIPKITQMQKETSQVYNSKFGAQMRKTQNFNENNRSFQSKSQETQKKNSSKKKKNQKNVQIQQLVNSGQDLSNKDLDQINDITKQQNEDQQQNESLLKTDQQDQYLANNYQTQIDQVNDVQSEEIQSFKINIENEQGSTQNNKNGESLNNQTIDVQKTQLFPKIDKKQDSSDQQKQSKLSQKEYKDKIYSKSIELDDQNNCEISEQIEEDIENDYQSEIKSLEIKKLKKSQLGNLNPNSDNKNKQNQQKQEQGIQIIEQIQNKLQNTKDLI